jgi:sulfur transfer complex TusBCD TusB component (DsrH family)
MLIIINNQLPTIEETFLKSTLHESDEILVCDQACHLAMQPKTWTVKGYIRDADYKKLGQQCHPDWTVITDQEWLNITLNQHKTISW